MPTVCEESGASGSSVDSTLDLKKKLLSQDTTYEKCTCHVFTPSGRQFGRTISLDPQLLNRCAECHKEKGRTKLLHHEKIAEETEDNRDRKLGVRLGTVVLEDRVGGTKLLDDTDGDVKEKLIVTNCEQNENDKNNKLEKLEDEDPERGLEPPKRKPWTRRKLAFKLTVLLIVIALAITGVVLGVTNKKSKDRLPPVEQRLQQPPTPPLVTKFQTHSPARNCSLKMELDKDNLETGTPDTFQSHKLPWRPLTSHSASNAILYSPEAKTFNVTESGYFTIHADVHIDTHFWISSEDLPKTFSSILCIQFPTRTPAKKCNTSKYVARTVRAQAVHTDIYLEKGETFYVTIEVISLKMIYHLPTDKNNIIEITFKNC
ncbi:uncharacterized protein LOC133180137 [Saccostrea echinata]|uniref:uncharacterized protein LOC133180137 n=1 Tax=Saccostrea echinata TaxID=191078 RepID=UPI002A834E08|nr:uncharacterized protein LOC133180137 [Saccostrea echinata]